MIDAHVHFREPGLTQKEDFYTGSLASAKGGVTTFIDMPNTLPQTTNLKLLEEKKVLAKKSIVDYGFHFGASCEEIDEIKKANKKNIASTKVFFNITTGKLLIKDEACLKKIFESSKIITVHAEDEEVKKAITFAKQAQKKVYLCHISQAKELEIIKKENYKQAYVEVTPHHLFMTDKDKSYLNIMKPELRTKKDVDALWKAINDGIINTIGSDHAPHLINEKKEKETYGVPGVETTLPLLLDASNNNKISLFKIQQLTSLNPAKIFGIKNKGEIKKGYDADLVIIDMNQFTEIKKEELRTKCKWNPFEGKKLKGKILTTIVRGKIVYNNEKIFSNIGKEVEFE